MFPRRLISIYVMTVSILLLLPPIVALPQVHASEVTVQEWLVPWANSRPRDPFVDPQGHVWFCGQGGNYIAQFDPQQKTFKRYELRTGTHPHNLIVDDQGMVWYAGNRNAHIGRLDPKTGKVQEFPMPDSTANDPHTLVFGHQDEIWFTLQISNMIGRLDRTSGKIDLINTGIPNSRPYGIKVDPLGYPWVVLFGTHQLATINPATLSLSLVKLPRSDARPRRLEIDDKGHIWYVDYRKGMLGHYDPKTASFKEWTLPAGRNARPYGTAIDQNNHLWIAETGTSPNRLISFNTRKEDFVDQLEIPSGGGSVRHMYFHPASNEIWFGTDKNTLGRIDLTE